LSRIVSLLGLSFCQRSFEFELKLADGNSSSLGHHQNSVFLQEATLQVKSKLLRESCLPCYLFKLHGDSSQTLLLCNAYSSLPLLSWRKAPPQIESVHLVESLLFGSPAFMLCSSKVDATICSAIATCYSQCLTLTKLILLQSTTCCRMSPFLSFPFQCTAISTLLHFQDNSKLQKSSHLVPFWDAR
jgi:hypothetical protein